MVKWVGWEWEGGREMGGGRGGMYPPCPSNTAKSEPVCLCVSVCVLVCVFVSVCVTVVLREGMFHSQPREARAYVVVLRKT